MFSRADANQLREGLEPISFLAGFPGESEVQPGGNSVAHKLAQSYRAHYGLGFDSASAHVLGIVESGPYKIVCQYFASSADEPRGTAVLLHGYFDHAGIYGHLIQHCLQLGFSVIIFDFPGHGLSAGPVATIASFREYNQAFSDCLVAAQKQGVTGPWTAIGQSTGGAIIIDSILDGSLPDEPAFQQYLLLGPLLRPRRWLKSKLFFSISRWFVAASPRKFSFNSHDQEFLRFLREDDSLQSKFLLRDWILAMIDYQRRFAKAANSDKKLHIIQGTGDGTVDWEYNLPKLMEKFPASKSYWIKDARHHLINESPEYRDQVFALISQIVEQGA